VGRAARSAERPSLQSRLSLVNVSSTRPRAPYPPATCACAIALTCNGLATITRATYGGKHPDNGHGVAGRLNDVLYIGLPTQRAPSAPRPGWSHLCRTKPIPAEQAGAAIFIPVSNPLERLNKEVKRRADVVGIFRVLSNAGWANNHLHLSTPPVLHIGRID
jgi:hypothetical protein